MSATFWNRRRRLKKQKGAAEQGASAEPTSKKEAKAALDAKGIEYSSKAKLTALLALLKGAAEEGASAE